MQHRFIVNEYITKREYGMVKIAWILNLPWWIHNIYKWMTSCGNDLNFMYELWGQKFLQTGLQPIKMAEQSALHQLLKMQTILNGIIFVNFFHLKHTSYN